MELAFVNASWLRQKVKQRSDAHLGNSGIAIDLVYNRSFAAPATPETSRAVHERTRSTNRSHDHDVSCIPSSAVAILRMSVAARPTA